MRSETTIALTALMKILLPLFLLLLCAGCLSRYQITLTNNNVITTKTKPKLNEAGTAYHFRDVRGADWVLPVFRIKEMAPL